MFDNRLDSSSVPPLPIVVARYDKPLSAIVQSRDWLGVRTHWFGGHTISCEGEGKCPACDANQMWVKKYYLVAVSNPGINQAIIMVTPVAAAVLVKFHKGSKGFLGQGIVLGRAARRANAPMTVRMSGYYPDVEEFKMDRFQLCIRRIFKQNALTR